MRILSHIEVGRFSIDFGIASEQEREIVRAQRFRVYAREGYFSNPPASFEDDPRYDRDPYDEGAIYFVAKQGGRIIGSARVVPWGKGKGLPVENAFKYEEPEELAAIPPKQRVEVGKLVSEAPEEIKSGELITTLGLIDAIIKYAGQNNIECGLAFLKNRLLYAFQRFYSLPVHKIQNAELIYPEDGILNAYFRNHDDGVTPVFFIRKEIGPVIDRLVRELNLRKSGRHKARR